MSKKNQDNIRCKKGEILKKGYNKKGYLRQGYVKKNGTVVKTKYIRPTHVAPTCVSDVGTVGHGNKTLPKPDKHVLTPFGYSIHNSRSKREDALKKSAKYNGILKVLKHLTLVHNYQTNPENKKRFEEDMEFMKKMYDPYRKVPRKKNQTGGASGVYNEDNGEYYEEDEDEEDEDEDDDENDDENDDNNDVNIITLPPDDFYLPNDNFNETKTTRTKLQTDNSKNYTTDKYKINGVEIVYRMINRQKENINILLMDIDGKPRGVYYFKIVNNFAIVVVPFLKSKYQSILYAYMEKYCKAREYNGIVVKLSKFKTDMDVLNFWFSKGFIIVEEDNEFFKFEKKIKNY